MNYICYYDLAFENKHGYKLGTETLTADSKVVKEMVIPGLGQIPAMYIRHINVTIGQEEYIVISYTDYELADSQKENIARGVFNYIKSMN